MNSNENINFTALSDALKSFEDGINSNIKNELERDGVIQRFEYTFELCWKSIRKLLLLEGRSEVSSSPKPIIREAMTEHLIDDLEIWFSFVDARNRVTHTYNQATAQEVFESIKNFAPAARMLLVKLNERLQRS